MTIYTLEFEVEDDEVIEQVVEFLQAKFPHLNMEFYESVQDEYLQ
jgi:short-subunit dehydrogenase involved in D-alanine esterification of teichoic acids